MASDGGYNSVDLTWSPCSRQQLLAFFRSVPLFTLTLRTTSPIKDIASAERRFHL